ncbi:MAG: UxaA family hydrolase [Clostridiaceae bacterium]
MMLKGYKRPDGKYGVRNHLLVIPTSVCASEVAKRVADKVEGAVAIPHQHGCCQMGEDFKQTVRTLEGFGKNPNVGDSLVIGLGCEGIQAKIVRDEIAKSGKPVEMLIIQEEGGTTGAVAEGIKLANGIWEKIKDLPTEEFPMSEIIIGLECGGSDPTSGLASNPTIGYASDYVVNEGGSSILSETTEVIGAEHIMVKRFPESEQEKFLFMVKRIEDKAIAIGEDLRGSQPTPGNIEGGLSTIEEKSLGCMFKAGYSDFKGTLEYSEAVPYDNKGLYFMDTPGEDIDSITGMLAGGAQIILFTTGRGTPTGSAIAPVIKITGNPDTYKKMTENIDINAGKIVTGENTLEEVGKELVDMIYRVGNGELTKAEILGHEEFGIYRISDTF